MSSPILLFGILSTLTVEYSASFLNSLTTTVSTGKIIFPFDFANKALAKSNLSSSTNEAPIFFPSAFKKVNIIAPPIKILSALVNKFSITPILSETFAPPKMAINGLFGLFTASNVGIAENIGNGNSAVGFLVEKELKFIGEAVNNPKRPLIAILGGAKVSDKIGVIENLLAKADKILIGGAMMFTFLKAEGKNVGTSLVEDDKLDLAKDLLAKSNGKIVLPVDTVVVNEFKNDTEFSTVDIDNIPDNKMGLDIGEKTVKLFDSYIKTAKTVVWNGPMGVFEMPNFAKGTIGICESIANLTDAVTIIGGGDSAAAAISLGYANKFTHISTGGGASLEFLEGKVLPGVEAISNK